MACSESARVALPFQSNVQGKGPPCCAQEHDDIPGTELEAELVTSMVRGVRGQRCRALPGPLLWSQVDEICAVLPYRRIRWHTS